VLARSGAVGQSPLSKNQRAPSVLAERAAAVTEQYAVVSSDDLTLHATHLVFDSATAADQALRGLVGAQPELGGAIQVVPTTVMPRAA
jgi:hypothetical protein